MSNINVTILVPAALVTEARHIADCISPAAHGMYVTALTSADIPTGKPLWYINHGPIEPEFSHVFQTAADMLAAAQCGAQTQGLECYTTLAQCEALIAESIVLFNADVKMLLSDMRLVIREEQI